MTKQKVLKTLITFFKDVNAVDPNLSDLEISAIKLPELDLFQHGLNPDPDFIKIVTFKQMLSRLTELYGGVEPLLTPHNELIFDRNIAIDTLAGEILEDN